MRVFAFITLIPALVLATACGTTPAGSGSGTDSDGEGSSSSASTGNPTTTNSTAGSVCIPGQSVACTCNGGESGAQVCNASGSGYEPCMCSGGTATTGPGTSATTSDPTATTGDVTATGGSTGVDASTGDVSSTGSTGGSSTGGSSTGGGGGNAYGPCPGGNDNECQPGEMCITGQTMMGMWSLCTTGTCQANGDCDSNACADAPGDGMFQQYCVGQICSQNNPCPMGQTCVAGFGMNPQSVCLWM